MGKRSIRKRIAVRRPRKSVPNVKKARTYTAVAQATTAPSSPAANTRSKQAQRKILEETPPTEVVPQANADGDPIDVVEKEIIELGEVPPEGMIGATFSFNLMKLRRSAIAYQMIQHKMPARDTWKGKGGVAAKIKANLSIKPGTDIIPEMEEIMSCHERKVFYDPSIKVHVPLR